jgi:membrane-associated protein
MGSAAAVDPAVGIVELSTLPPNIKAYLDFLVDFYHRVYRDLPTLVQTAGYVGLTIIIFAETGLLVGFFLPGDSLMVTAGLLCTQEGFALNVWYLGALLSIAAIVGDTVGYNIGRTAGPHIFTRENSLFFNKKHLHRAQAFYEKHGGKTIFIARFMPIIRTFAPVVAGVGNMKYSTFLAYNAVGGVVWVWSMLMIGYLLGRTVPGVATHIDKIIIVVVFLSILPGIIAWLRNRNKPPAESAA